MNLGMLRPARDSSSSILRRRRGARRAPVAAAALLVAAFAAASLGAQVAPGPQKPGFPATLAGGSIRAGHPAVADLGLTPGHKSIVFGTSLHKLYVVLYDGSVAPGFPVTLPAESSGSPAVGDLTGDGVPEIVVSYGSTFEPGVPGGVRAYRRDGTVLWDRPAGDFNGDGTAEPVITAPAIGDVDGDGANEVAWGGVDGDVYLVNGATGANKPGFPVFVRDSIRSSPALHDFDGDGRLEIVIGVDAHAEGPPFNTPDGGCLHVLRSNGTERPGFPKCIDQTIVSSAAVGDIDGDGKPEIVVGTGSFYPHRAHQVYAWKCDGTAVPGWPVGVDGEVSTSPALADLDGDGVLDVVVTDNNASPSTAFHVYAFKGSGTRLWKTVPKTFFGTTPNAGDPVVADVAGDGKVEVLVPINTEVAVLSAAGVQLTDDGSHFAGSFSYFTETTLSHVVVDNFESDASALEVVAVSATSQAGSSRVWVWNPKVSSAIPWGAFHQNAKRTGTAPGTPSCQAAGPPLDFYTLSPCRVVDTRNPAGPQGGPALPAHASRTFTLAGQCGVPRGRRRRRRQPHRGVAGDRRRPPRLPRPGLAAARQRAQLPARPGAGQQRDRRAGSRPVLRPGRLRRHRPAAGRHRVLQVAVARRLWGSQGVAPGRELDSISR